MREFIIAAAMEEIKERGLRFTMQDLATRLKVSKRSLYENFTSKEELIGALLEIILTDMERLEEQICASAAKPTEKLRQLLTVHPYDVEMFNKNIYEDLKRMFPVQWQVVEKARLKRQERLERLIEEGIAAGELRPIHIGIVSQLVRGLCLNGYYAALYINAAVLLCAGTLALPIAAWLYGGQVRQNTFIKKILR